MTAAEFALSAAVLVAVISSAGYALAAAGWGRVRQRDRSIHDCLQRTSSSDDATTRYAVSTPEASVAAQQVHAAVRASVIIAARNHASALTRTLDALLRQSLPRAEFEVLVVDDASQDDTVGAAARHPVEPHVFRVEAHSQRSPKKDALALGIAEARSPVLLFTDADCAPESEWIACMLEHVDAGADVVIGRSPVSDGRGAAGDFLAWDAARSALLAVGAVGWDIPYMAVGRNWCYRRSIFERAGGFGDGISAIGGDDDLLLQRFSRAGARITACTVRGAHAPAAPPEGWRSVVRSRRRHLRVGLRYRGVGAAVLTVLQTVEVLAMLVAPAVLLASGVHAGAVCAAWWALAWYNGTFVLQALPRASRPHLLLRPIIVPARMLLHVALTTMLALSALVRRPSW